MKEKDKNNLVKKFEEASEIYREGRLIQALRNFQVIRRSIKISDEKFIYEQTEENIKKINKLIGLKRSRNIVIITVAVIFIILVFGLIKKINNSFITIDVFTDDVSLLLGTEFTNIPVTVYDFEVTGAQDIKLKVLSVDIASFDENNNITWHNMINTKNEIQITPTDPSWSLNVKSDYMVLETLTIHDSSNVRIKTSYDDRLLLNIGRGRCDVSLDTDHTIFINGLSCSLHYLNKELNVDGKQLKIILESPQVEFNKLSNRNMMISFIPDTGKKINRELHNGKNLLVHEIVFDKKLGNEYISSIIEESNLVYNDFHDRKYKIFPNEYLVLKGLQNFLLTDLNISGKIKLRGAGYVKKAAIGNHLNIQDCTPTLLEWIVENEKINLFIGLLLPVASLILAVLYRLKIIDEN